jgi:CubicO group peptidase (beta-lactamase class C family)
MSIDRARVVATIENSSTKIVDLIRSRIESQATPGLVAALFFEGKTIWFHGAGVRQLGGAAPEDSTAFRVASCTKSFTAAATLLLRDRGLLTLDDPITKYMPSYTQTGPLAHCASPTLRMLLTMSAGFGTDDPWADREESITPAELESHVANGVYLISVPGSRYEYSNLGYALLGRVIELVSEQTFPGFVTREIFVPLKLNDSSFSLESSAAPGVAIGYRRRGEDWVAQEFSTPGSFSSIGGVFSSARDLAKWANWLAESLDPDSTESGPLSLATRREMQQLHVPMPFSDDAATTVETRGRLFGYGFALHVDIDERHGKFVSHSGGYPGYSAHMRWHEHSGIGVVVLENARYSGAWSTATRILESVIKNLSPAETPQLTEELDYFISLASALIFNWTDEVADEICAPNVALDIPYAERSEEIAKLLEQIGEVREAKNYAVKTDESALHVKWLIPGEKANLLCEIRLTPVLPLKIQTLRITVNERF